MAWLEWLNVFSSSWNLKHGTNHCWKHFARMTLVDILVTGQSMKRQHLLCLSCGLVLITLCLIKYWYFPFPYFDLYQISWLVSWEPKGNSADSSTGNLTSHQFCCNPIFPCPSTYSGPDICFVWNSWWQCQRWGVQLQQFTAWCTFFVAKYRSWTPSLFQNLMD